MCSIYHLSLVALVKAASSCVDELETLAYEFSSFNGHIGGNKEFREDLIRCHALLLGSEFTTRVNTLPAFTEANRMVRYSPTPHISHTSHTNYTHTPR